MEVPSRKIYAVQATELTPKGKGVRRKSVVISSEDSENDLEETPAQKKIKKEVSNTNVVIEEIR